MHKYRHLCILLLYSRCYDYFCCRLRRKRLCRRRGAAAPRRPPRRHDRRHHGAQQRRFQTRRIAAPSPRSGEPNSRRHHRGEPVRTRRRVPGPAARRLRGDRGAAAGRHPGHRRRRRPPAGGRGRLGEVLRLPARRDLALRAARASRPARGAPRRQADRRTRLLPDVGPAGPHPGLQQPPAAGGRRRHRFRLRHLRGRQGRQGQPDRRRGHGLHEPLRRGRRPPAHPGNRAGARPRP